MKKPEVDRRETFEVKKRPRPTEPDMVVHIREEEPRRWVPRFRVKLTNGRIR